MSEKFAFSQNISTTFVFWLSENNFLHPCVLSLILFHYGTYTLYYSIELRVLFEGFSQRSVGWWVSWLMTATFLMSLPHPQDNPPLHDFYLAEYQAFYALDLFCILTLKIFKPLSTQWFWVLAYSISINNGSVSLITTWFFAKMKGL